MDREPVSNRKHLPDRKNERGSALIVALFCLLCLCAITLAVAKVRISSARDIEDKTNQSIQYWTARSAAAAIQASLITDIPPAFDSDLQRAQVAANGYPLPAFDPANITAGNSLPVLNADGSISSTPTRQCTSLLGNLDAWAQRKSSIAESYAASKGYGTDKARVAVLREYQRQQLVGVGNSEPAYILQYVIDASVGTQGNARGRVRPSGTIMLGPSQPSCNTTVALAANPSTIPLGGSSTLTVTYTNANRVWLVDQTGAVVSGTDTSGLTETNSTQTINFTVSPTDDTSYRAFGQGSSGCQAISAFVTVTVTYPPPTILAFDATPSCINRGDTATLSFTVQYATTITITGGGVNQTFAGNGTGTTSGSLTVAPTVDTTYTITASGKGGTASRNVSITVKQPITVDSFISDTYCLTPPANTVNLTWAVSNAETVTITDNSTEVVTGVSNSGGTRTFTVTGPTTFTITASRTGCDGTPDVATRTISIDMNAVPTASFSANPSTIQIGSTSLLQWSTTNTTDNSQITISASPAAGSGVPAPQTVTPNGTLRIQPTAVNTYTYTLNVTNAGCNTQTISKTTTVTVSQTPVPPSCPNVQSFDGDACIVNGNPASLRWNVANADFVDVSGPGVSRTFSANPVGTGSFTVSPTSDATYTLTARTAATGPQAVIWQAGVGVTASSNNLTKNAPDGWDAGASSAQSIVSGDGYVEFTASETNKYRMLGLSNGDSNQVYTDIDFAFYPAADGGLYVYESGNYRGYFGPYATGDLLRVAIEGGTVKYKRNGTLLYSSTISPTYPLLVDTSLYSNGATLNNVVISGNVQTNTIPSTTGLIAYWNLDEGSGGSGADTSGNNHTGYLLDGTTWTNGKVGSSALSFDGANNLFGMNIDDAGLVNTFTYSFWAYPTQTHTIDPESTSGYAGYSGQKRFAVSPSWYEAGEVDAGISVATNGVSVYENGDSDFAPLLVYNASISGWTHITVVFENKRPRLYINGVLVRTGLTSRQGIVHSTPGYIGGGFYGYYGGNLDDIRVYNRALSPTEIQTVAGNSSAGAASCTPASPPAPTIATFTVHVGQRPIISNLAASPGSVDAGQSSRLTWANSGNFSTVSVIGSGGDPNTYTVPAAQGYLDVRPASSATYTVMATSNDCAGQSASQSVSVTVTPCPSITSPFTASPGSIYQGGTSTLTWGIANVAQVLLNGTPVAPSGSLAVSPATSSTYQLTAVSANGFCSFNQFVTVAVVPCPAPTINFFSVSPSSVFSGGSSNVTLSWSTTDNNGTGVTVTIPGVGTFGPSGSISIPQPQSTTTYQLFARSGCGSQSMAAATVTVGACPQPTINSFTAAPSSVTVGNHATVRLSWDVTDSSGTGVTISIAGVGSWTTTTGFVDIAQPQASTTYTLTARAGCGAQSTATTTVTANACPPPVINSFTSAPSSVIAGNSGTVRLSWSVSDPSGTGVTVVIAGVGTFGPSGFIDIAQPQTTTTYTLTATAGCGAQATAQTTVTVNACPPPVINSFSASPNAVTIGASQTVRLAWNISDPSGSGITVTIQGVGTWTTATGFVDIAQPQSTTSYTLTARANCGAQSTATTTVTASNCPAPVINSFTATPSSVTVGGNVMVRLQWSISDPFGTGVTISIPGVGTFSNPNFFVDISQPQSTTTYTLSATSGCGATSSAQATVTAVACAAPTINSFSASPSNVTIGGGQTVRFSWSVTDNSATGVSVSIAGVGTFGPSGFVDIPQPQSTTTYTLTATAGCGAQASSSATITASACPTPSIDTFTISPGSVTIGGSQTIHIAWSVSDTSATGLSVSITGVGSVAPSGSADIAQPQSTTTYTLTATNGCGAQNTRQVTVVANPPSAVTASINLPFFSPTSGGPLFSNPDDPVVSRFPGTYSFTATGGLVASASIQWGSYPIPTINTCFGTQSFVAADGPWTIQFMAADGTTVLDSFTFDRPSYSGAAMSWTGTTPLAQSAVSIRFYAGYYTNRYALDRETGTSCDLQIDHYHGGHYVGLLDLSTGTFTNGGQEEY